MGLLGINPAILVHWARFLISSLFFPSYLLYCWTSSDVRSFVKKWAPTYIYIYIYILISKKDVYSKGYFMHEKHKASQNLQRRKKQTNKQTNKGKKKKKRKIINYKRGENKERREKITRCESLSSRKVE